MRPENVKVLYRFLIECEFRFIPDGEYTLSDIYRLVKTRFPELCDDTYLCSASCKGGHNQPEWKHGTRGALFRLKIYSDRVARGSERGHWCFVSQ